MEQNEKVRCVVLVAGAESSDVFETTGEAPSSRLTWRMHRLIRPVGNNGDADRVQKFAPDGTFLAAFGEAGEGPGQFRHAMAVDVAADGTVFVADFLNNRIHKWRPKE